MLESTSKIVSREAVVRRHFGVSIHVSCTQGATDLTKVSHPGQLELAYFHRSMVSSMVCSRIEYDIIIMSSAAKWKGRCVSSFRLHG